MADPVPIIVSSNISKRTKPTFASSAVVGLTVRATGEEETQVLDHHGNMFPASIYEPTVAPTIGYSTGGSVTPNKRVAYRYVYAATNRYPMVENAVSMDGMLSPRSQPSPWVVADTTGGNRIVLTIPHAPAGRLDIDEIWVFRTEYFEDSAAGTTLAETAAEAGQIFYIGKIATISGFPGNVTYNDDREITSTDQLELDNFAAPTFWLVWYDDPYWYGFGNLPFEADVTWATDGSFTLDTPNEKWFTGRNGQDLRFIGVNVGGYDGLGTFKFKWVSATTGQTVDEEGNDLAFNIATPAGSGIATLQGPATTLYRSKRRNPFAWGTTVTVGEQRVSAQNVFRVGGGHGTAIFSLPNLPYLILSTEGPAAMYSLDLRTAGTDAFEGSKFTLSRQYSVSSHWSQFVATRGDGSTVMWGLDAKNFAILECDGNSVRVVSNKVSKTLRTISTNISKQLMSHGAYDSFHQINCIWFPTANASTPCNFLIFQHVPTGSWFFCDEHDIICSAAFNDPKVNTNKIFVGTEAGLLGQAFVDGRYNNWLPVTGGYRGTCWAPTAASIQRLVGEAFNIQNAGMIGNWVLVTDANNANEQWARISAVTSSGLSFDKIYSYIGGSAVEFNPVPASGSKYYVGLIESTFIKYLDLGQPDSDKKIDEIFATLQNVDILPGAAGRPSCFLRFYRERQISPISLPTSIATVEGACLFLKQLKLNDNSLTDGWNTPFPYTELLKSIGIEFVDRGFEHLKVFNWVMRGKTPT